MKKTHYNKMYVAVLYGYGDLEMVKWESLSPTKKRCLEIIGNNAHDTIKLVAVAIAEMPTVKRKTKKRVAEAITMLMNNLFF